MKEVVMT